ncbi:aldo/keto reductase, partial [Nisaea sp.]
MLETRTYHDIKFSSVGIGTWAIGGPYWTQDEPTGWGGPLDDNDSVTGLKMAISAGLNHVDTADVYGYGRSERLVGKALSDGPQVTLASKVGFVSTSSPSVYTAENIRYQIEQSLRNLRREALEIYYIHHCDFGPENQYLEEASDTLHKLRDEGKILTIGLSGYSADDLIAAAKVLKPQFIQSWATIEHREYINPEMPLAKFMLDNDIRFVAMMPFGQGRILGKYSAKNPPSFEHGDNRIGNPEFEGISLGEFEPKLKQLQDRFGETPNELIVPALGYLLKHEVVASVIPGFRNSEQVS